MERCRAQSDAAVRSLCMRNQWRNRRPSTSSVPGPALSPCEAALRPERHAAQMCPVDWLFHIDVDELLYPLRPVTLPRAVCRVRGRLLHVPVHEAAKSNPTYRKSSEYNFFRHEHHAFRGVRHLSYGNGKSAARPDCALPLIHAWGPHLFSYGGTAQRQFDTSCCLVVLHYPFMHFRKWASRYNVGDAALHSVNWGFYNESHEVLAHRPNRTWHDFYLHRVFLKAGAKLRAQSQGKLLRLEVEQRRLSSHSNERCPSLAQYREGAFV